jgi:peptide/nickel transport system substrate-binding protein
VKSSPRNIVVTLLALVLAASLTFAQDYTEAPMLERQVAAGELPAVDQRLPDVPFVVGPGVLTATEWTDWTVGNYSDGQILTTVHNTYKAGYPGVGVMGLLWSPDNTTDAGVPAIVESYSVNDDSTVFDFTIRKGVKWSDGVEVTTEDVRFTFEDLYQNPDTGISYTSQLYALGNSKYPPAELTIHDESSFSLTFDRSYGWFEAELISWISTASEGIIMPSEFLKGYHPDYTDVDTLNAMAEEAGLEGWQQHLQAKTGNHWQILFGSPHKLGVPSFQPYEMAEVTDTSLTFKRNPYFWMVDTEGQQLPYIDEIDFIIIQENDAINLKILSGDVHWVADDFAKLPSMPTYIAGAEQGNYEVRIVGGFSSAPMLFINQDYDYEDPDSQWQQLMQDPDNHFGAAVALAIDSDDINDTLFFGKYKQDTIVTTRDYNPAEANQLLDALGLSERDASGFRTYPDGSPLQITINAINIDPGNIDTAQMISQYLQAVGLNVDAQAIDGGIFDPKVQNNEYQMTIFWHDAPAWASGISQDYWPGWKGGWAPKSALYIDTNGEQGREPPAYIQEFFDIHVARKAFAPGSAEGEAKFAELLQYFSDTNVMVWPAGDIVQPFLVSNDIGNGPNEGYPIIFGALAAIPQWYFAE